MAVFQAQSGPLLPILDGLSRKYGKSPSQIVLRWIYQQGVLSITSTVSDVRAKEALESYDFVIDEEDQKTITEVGASHVFQRYPEFVDPNFVNNSY
jgi:diketogulonate reductase-like aldo/keto reductase